MIQRVWRGALQRQRLSAARKAAVLVQTQWRAHAARTMCSQLRAQAAAAAAERTAAEETARRQLAAVRLQAIVRGWLLRRQYESVVMAREAWRAYLEPSESVLYASLVGKRSGLWGRRTRRQLALTSNNRFVYVNPMTREMRGE